MNKLGIKMGAAVTAGYFVASAPAYANAKTFEDITLNIMTSIQDFPAIVTGLAYMFGIMLGVLGILKIKDHVENPGNTPLKDGAIRLAAGGALFAIPIMFEAMQETIGSDGTMTDVNEISKLDFMAK